MSRFRVMKALSVLLVLSTLCAAEDDATKAKKKLEGELTKLEAQIKKTPDDPVVHYRRAQALTKLERWDDGYAEAQKTMELFIKKGDDLAWLLLESIDLGGFRVDVNFNMGPKERKTPDIGIVRPLSFRIWKKADPAVKDSKDELVEIIDFEFAYIGGKPETAAFGIQDGKTHKNLGMVDVTTAYKDLRVKAIELIKKRHPQEEPKDPPK